MTGAFDQNFVWDPQGLPSQMSYPLRQDEAACGARLAFHTYYPFGEEATTFNQDTDRLKFTGHERDLGSAAGAGDDVDYMHARFCSPILGRFWSVDPALSAKPDRPQSWNRYAYGLGNPIRLLDPDGRDTRDSLAGFADAFVSDFTLGLIGRSEPTSEDYRQGQAAGDVAATIAGIAEADSGANGLAFAAVCLAASEGACSPAAALETGISSGMVLHGSGMAIAAGKNLADTTSQMRDEGPGSSGAGDIRKVDDSQIKKSGLDAEALKQDPW